jgi:SOS-response transcriptional repressor LexA
MKKQADPKSIVRDEVSPQQLAVLKAIRDHIWKNQVSPTYEEVAQHVSSSKSNVRRLITLLTRKGLLTTAPGRFRNLVVTPQGFLAACEKKGK